MYKIVRTQSDWAQVTVKNRDSKIEATLPNLATDQASWEAGCLHGVVVAGAGASRKNRAQNLAKRWNTREKRRSQSHKSLQERKTEYERLKLVANRVHYRLKVALRRALEGLAQ